MKTPTTLPKLIEYLQTLPPYTTIQVLREKTGSYQTSAFFEDLEIEKNTEFWGASNGEVAYLELGIRN